ncbi:CTDP1 family protein [Megaselia abdita]
MEIENKNKIFAENDMKIKKWRVREGFPVNASQVILLYEENGTGSSELKRLKASKIGVVKKRLCKDGEFVERGTAILELSECVHTTVIKDMCADCGADLRQNDNGNQSEASVPMVHSVPDLKVTEKLAQQLGKADTKRLLEEKKLVLLVDLDQTVIHTTNDSVPNNIKDIYHFQLYGPHSPWYHTRLRPGTHDFLSKMSEIFELHICTFGARNYAHMIAQLLDADGKLFSQRILSRDECLNISSKTDNLKALFPCGDSMVCIIDDREDVWNMASNLIQVKPYHFFQHTGDINAPPGMSKHELDGKGMDFKDLEKKDTNDSDSKTKSDEDGDSNGSSGSCSTKKDEDIEINVIDMDQESKPSEDKTDEGSSPPTPKIKTNFDNSIEIEDPDDYILYLETILRTIHKRFYEIYDEANEIPDLKILVPKIRSEVLRGTCLVFSGLVPVNMKLEQSRAYSIAKALGANVFPNINGETTHLVALTPGTFKVNTAKKRSDIKIVSADWLWTCAERWEHVEELLYQLDKKRTGKQRHPPAHCHSPEHVVNYADKSEIPSTSNCQEPAKFVDTINPWLSFSNADLDEMNKEVDQFFESDSSSEDEHVNIDKKLRKRKREELNEQRRKEVFCREESTYIEKASKDETNPNSSEEDEKDDDLSPSVKFRRGGDLPSDLDMGSDSNDVAEGDDGDEWNLLGAALEKGFLEVKRDDL